MFEKRIVEGIEAVFDLSDEEIRRRQQILKYE
jgi:hypothetical protein